MWPAALSSMVSRVLDELGSLSMAAVVEKLKLNIREEHEFVSNGLFNV